jgi:hypothetical protein
MENKMTDQETMQTFEEAIKTHLIENRDQLVKQAVSSAMEKMAESMKWTAMNQASKQLEAFFTESVGPEVQKYLDANRESLIATVVSTIKGVVDYGLKKQAEDWLKEMDNQYSRSSVINKMFGGKGY